MTLTGNRNSSGTKAARVLSRALGRAFGAAGGTLRRFGAETRGGLAPFFAVWANFHGGFIISKKAREKLGYNPRIRIEQGIPLFVSSQAVRRAP